jgi:hypothetical protein
MPGGRPKEKEMGELLVCLTLTSDDRKLKLGLATATCYGHICLNNLKPLEIK